MYSLISGGDEHKAAMKTGPYLLLLFGLPPWVSAQDPPEIASHHAPATFSSNVNLVSVPVVVRDGKGHAVGNLRQEDFRLFDKGKQQVIAKFSVLQNGGSGAAGPAAGGPAENPAASGKPASMDHPLPDRPLPDRYVAYVFDDIHLNGGDLAKVRAAAERHFAEALAPTSRAAIYTTSGRVTLDFTDDREKLHEALLRISVGPSAQQPADVACPPNITDYEADLVVNKQDPGALGAVTAEVIRCYGPFDGADKVAMGIAKQVLGANHTDTASTMNLMAGVVQRLSVMPGSRSIVLVSPGFLLLSEVRGQEMELMDRAIHSNIVISSLNARGLYTTLLGDAASSKDRMDSPRRRYRYESAQADENVMAELADSTGGRFFHNDNGLKEGLNQLAALPEYTYVLGFSPQNLKFDGSYHGLKVTLVNSKGLELQARRGYWAPNHAADAAEQAKEEIQEAVFSLEEVRDIPVDVTTEFFKTGDAMAELTVESRLDLTSLKFRTAGDRNDDTLTVVTGLFDQDGHYVRGIQRVIDLRLREQTLRKVLGSGMDVKETFDIAPGRYVVRVVVRDSEGQAMAARNGTVDIR
jgi:VWFA-related protein